MEGRLGDVEEVEALAFCIIPTTLLLDEGIILMMELLLIEGILSRIAVMRLKVTRKSLYFCL